MFRGIFGCFFALLCADRPTLGQTKTTQPSAVASANDAEYRRFEEVSSFVRARNARDFAFSAAKGIDEASYVTIGGIEQCNGQAFGCSSPTYVGRPHHYQRLG